MNVKQEEEVTRPVFCAQPSASDSDDLEEMERLRKEHIEALREIKRLQVRPQHPRTITRLLPEQQGVNRCDQIVTSFPKHFSLT